jgi:hypothetical protein
MHFGGSALHHHKPDIDESFPQRSWRIPYREVFDLKTFGHATYLDRLLHA